MKNLRTGTAKFDTIRAKDANGLSIQDDGGNGLFIKDGGNVGIGTTNPYGKLHVQVNTDTYASFNYASNGFGGTTSDEVALTYSNKLHFGAVNSSNNPQITMSLLKDGNVGIGTKNPGAKLDVTHSSNTEVTSRFYNGGGSAPATVHIVEGGNASDHVGLFVGAADLSSAVLITKQNDVGIGTTSPAYKLDLVGNNSEYAARLGSTGTNPYGLVIQYVTGFSPTASNYFIDCVIGSTKKFSIESNGTVRSNGTALTSDDRVKHNEEIITGAIDTIKKITPKKYIKTSEIYDHDHNFDLDSNGYPIDENGEPVPHTVEAGVIAQEVLGVDELKFAVSPETKDEDGNVTSPHGLNYNSLFTYAIAAIQEQQSIIEDLKSQNASLESRISALES